MQKLYCYIDETGQDAGSKFFLVSVVIAEGEREKMVSELYQFHLSIACKLWMMHFPHFTRNHPSELV